MHSALYRHEWPRLWDCAVEREQQEWREVRWLRMSADALVVEHEVGVPDELAGQADAPDARKPLGIPDEQLVVPEAVEPRRADQHLVLFVLRA